jgi:hypothetical protein
MCPRTGLCRLSFKEKEKKNESFTISIEPVQGFQVRKIRLSLGG